MSTSTLRYGEEPLSHLRQNLRTWAQLWKADEILDVRFEFSKRMRTSLGRCYLQRKIVRLNEILLLPGNEDLITEVACHEVAHAAVQELYGDGCRPHGPEWSELVRAVGFPPRMKAVAAGPEPKTRRSPTVSVLYEHRCSTCNAMRVVRRPMVHWRCSECVAAGLTGKLIIISRPTARKAMSNA